MKFCILAAGKGSRNNSIEGLHKALLPLNNKATISHIIEGLDPSIEIVIALGYKSEQITTFLSETYPERTFTYVYVDNYDRPGSGPGYSLLCCKDHLQEPFVFTSVDTLTSSKISNKIDYETLITSNWIGASNVDSSIAKNYCLIDYDGRFNLKRLYYGEGSTAYIGMAGIHDYEVFWKSLEDNRTINGEHQVTNGFNDLKNVNVFHLNWYDTGNNESYEETKKVFSKEVVANKTNESIFIYSNRVIKYFKDPEKIDTLLKRQKFLNGTNVEAKKINSNMFSSDFIEGKLLSDIYNDRLLEEFLEDMQLNLFSKTKKIKDEFLVDCKTMYEDKTKQRLTRWEDTDLDSIKYINGIKVEPIKKLLDKIDWQVIYNRAIPSIFHGDLQPENVIYDGTFKLIDWRDSFGSSLEVGDVYYDLSKIYHGLLINGTNILKGYYDYTTKDDSVELSFLIKNNLETLRNIFKKFVDKHDYNMYNIVLLSILHYLNISVLYDNFHEGKYGSFLFLYGKYLLTKHLNKELL